MSVERTGEDDLDALLADGQVVDPPTMPPWIAPHVEGRTWCLLMLGMSGDDVYRMVARPREDLYLKVGTGPDREVLAEAERSAWLASVGFPAPLVVASGDWKGVAGLLTEALAGQDLVSTMHRSPVAVLADGLGRLHALDPCRCPFDGRLAATMDLARRRVRSGLVDARRFDAERRRAKSTPESVLAWLEATAPADEDLMVAHGDACMPNALARDGAFSGFVDCGRLGVADRPRDVALACRSLSARLGKRSVGAFLDAYGRDKVDPSKLTFYQALDELL